MFRFRGVSIGFSFLACAGFGAIALAVDGVGQEAEAQYRAGSFVNGQPVYARRRPSGNLMRLRARRKANRARRRRNARRSYRRRRAAPVRTVRPAAVRPVQQATFALPPLPSPHGTAIADAQSRPLSPQRTLWHKLQRNNRRKVMQIVVSLGQQRMTVYQDGRLTSRSRVSTGKAGHRTPTGVFSIIQKRRFHRSNIYSGAPMPYMQRITWSGIALHQGPLPGYAASHGCVRLPGGFARSLFKSTQMRTHVVVSGGNPAPRLFSHPNLPGLSDLRQVKLAVLSPEPARAAPAVERDTSAFPALAIRVPVRYVTGSVGARGGREAKAYDSDVYALAAMLHFDQAEMLAHRKRATSTRRATPLRLLVTRRTQRDQLRDVQRQLAVLGYDIGELDGRLGRMTITAVKMFQRAHKLRASGYPDAATRDLLDKTTGLPRPSVGTVYLRQDGKQIYAGPVELEHPEAPLGTHLYTLLDFDEEETGVWTAMTVQGKGRLPLMTRRAWQKQLAEIEAVTAKQAIGRIKFPEHVRAAIEDRLTPGSSLIIADRGSERETGLATDFVVLTDR